MCRISFPIIVTISNFIFPRRQGKVCLFCLCGCLAEPCFNLKATEKDLSPTALVAVACERSRISGKRQPKIRLCSQAVVAGIPAEA